MSIRIWPILAVSILLVGCATVERVSEQTLHASPLQIPDGATYYIFPGGTPSGSVAVTTESSDLVHRMDEPGVETKVDSKEGHKIDAAIERTIAEHLAIHGWTATNPLEARFLISYAVGFNFREDEHGRRSTINAHVMIANQLNQKVLFQKTGSYKVRELPSAPRIEAALQDLLRDLL